jgi:hypothetical protein
MILTENETEARCEFCCGPIYHGDYLIRTYDDEEFYVCEICLETELDTHTVSCFEEV